MSTAPTFQGPTRTQQLNNELYVGQGGLTTIQKAVTAAVATGQPFNVIIPAGYTGSDTIAAITGGSFAVNIVDKRGQLLNYEWNSNEYVGPIVNLNGQLYSEADLYLLGYPLTIEGDLTTGNSTIKIHTGGALYLQDAAGSGQAIIGGETPATAAVFQAGNMAVPTATIDTLTATDITADTCEVDNSPVRTFANTPDAPGAPTYPPAGVGISTGTAWGTTSIDPATLPRQDASGDMTLAGNLVAATLLANSAIHTNNADLNTLAGNGWWLGDGFVNGPDAGGSMAFSVFQSIANTYGFQLLFSGDLIGGGNNTPIPGFWFRTFVKGIFSSWTYIDLSQDFTTKALTVNSPAAGAGIVALNVLQPNVTSGAVWAAIGKALAQDGCSMVGFDPVAKYATLGVFGRPLLAVDGSGSLRLAANSAITPDGNHNLIVGWNAINNSGATSFVNLSTGSTPGGFQWFETPSGQLTGAPQLLMGLDNKGTLQVAVVNGGGVTIFNSNAKFVGATPNIRTDTNNSLVLNAGSTGTLYLNFDTGTGGVQFGNGASGAVAMMDASGNFKSTGTITSSGAGGYQNFLGGTAVDTTTQNQPWGFKLHHTILGNSETDFVSVNSGGQSFAWFHQDATSAAMSGYLMVLDNVGNLAIPGTMTAASKTFRIPHPLDKSKDLVHGCLEGPEHAVFYRGEGKTTPMGVAEIQLPDYFEALTSPEGRTIQLTAIVDDESFEFGVLAATRIKGGRFTVKSSMLSQPFYWEVKATRADVLPLEVVAAKS
jgi:hypothetical protein